MVLKGRTSGLLQYSAPTDINECKITLVLILKSKKTLTWQSVLRFVVFPLTIAILPSCLFFFFCTGHQSGFWMCTHTIPPYCVHWFCWIPTNNLWSIASLSRLMLCFWLMSATINGLMLPNFLQPRTNPPIWVTVGSAGKQKHVCTVTHLSSDCHSSPSWSFIQLLFSFNHLVLSLSLNMCVRDCVS